MKRIEYEQRRHDAIARHTGDQYGYYGEMMDVDYDYIAALEARIAELETTMLQIDEHYEDTHAEALNLKDKCIAELEAENAAMRKYAIVWQKYPEEIPKSRGDYYLVAMIKYVHYKDEITDAEFDKVTEVPFVRVGFWHSPGCRFEASGQQLNDVYAWAEMPAPSEEEK